LLLALVAASVHAKPHLYRFDTTHSQIMFSVGHNGFSHALGRLHIAAGWLRFDPEDWSRSATVLDIDLRSVDMGDADWSKTVRGASLLDAERDPLAHFVSTSVQKTGPQSGLLKGRLTLRGVTRPVVIVFNLNRIAWTVFDMKTIAGFSASARLDRTDFGITRNSGSIGSSVTVQLEIEASRDANAHHAYQQWKRNHAAAQ
jgi:polyisoprenoid-binding protein YceI